MGAVGLQTHIWANNLRSTLLLAGFPVLLIGLVYAAGLGLMGAGVLPSTGDVRGDLAFGLELLATSAPLAVVAALVWFAVAYFANQALIDMATGARPVTRAEQPQLYNLLENLCISRGMRTPRLHVIESSALNAYASGLHEGRFVVTVTRGLVEALTPAELEAVLAHELTHIINRDVRTMVVASVFAGVITLLAQMLYRGLLHSGRGRLRNKGSGLLILIAVASAAIGYLLAIVIRLAISRRREFVADAGAVELTKDPDAMVSALMKISGRTHLDAPDHVRGMFLENREAGVMSLFATHPPIARRIDALVRFAGARLPEPEPEPPRAAGPWG